MRRSRKASRNEALVATVSLRALKSRLPDLASLDHQGMRPQRKDMSIRSGSPPVRRLRAVLPGRAGRSRTPRTWSVGATFQLGCVFGVDVLGQGGPEVAGDPGRRGVESEASAHAGCIVAQYGARRGAHGL